MVKKSVIQEEVAKLLAGADLNHLTEKKVRKQLEEKLGVSLADRKSDIKEAIESVLSENQATDEEEDAKSSKSSGSNDAGNKNREHDDDTDSSLSELEDGPVKKSAKPSTSVSSSAKKQKLGQDSAALTDEELARQLHLKENGLTTRRRRTVGKDSSSKSASKSKKTPRKSGGGFSKPCALSPALASVVGCDSMPRQQVVKRLWDIAKERDMFDPKNKQFVICDAEFEQLFGKKRLRMFALMKYLKNHVKNVD